MLPGEDGSVVLRIRPSFKFTSSHKYAKARRSISSKWMDASHESWFNSLFDLFVGAIRRGEFVSREAREAYRCIRIITTAYHSAAQGCRELPLGYEF